jgi:type II secretory pathway component GspD/PulD (secretin)
LGIRLIVAAGLMGVAGCVESTHPTVSTGVPQLKQGAVVVSTMPEEAAAAYDESERQVSQADWRVLNRLGPQKPLIEGAGTIQESNELKKAGRSTAPSARAVPFAKSGAGAAQAGPTPAATVASRPTTAPAATAPAGDTLSSATTQPSSVAGASTTSGLPLAVLPLPNDQVQLIWELRNIGGTSVTAQLDQGTSRRKVTVQAPDLKPLMEVVQGRLGKTGTVLPLPQKNALVITCPRTEEAAMVELLRRLDVPQIQVHIAAKIFETSHDFDFQQGARLLLNHVASDGTQSVLSTFDTKRLLDQASNGDTAFQGSVMSLVQVFEKAGISLNASLQLLAESGLISVVSSPRMTVGTGQTGYMLAGQELPIQSSTIVGTQLEISTSYKPVGVQLYITPESAGEDSVKLHLITIVSSVEGFAPLPTLTNSAATLVNPIIKSREAETVVTTRPGSTLVISGMKMFRSITRENKVPVLGDLPLIGNLFKNHRSQRQMTDLYFFITPTLASAE